MEIVIQKEMKFNLGLSVGIQGLIQCNAESPNENQNSGKWIKVCAALAEDLRSVPSTYVGKLTTAFN